MKIRTENADDYKAVYDLHFLAFGSREDESKLVERIRQSEGFVPDLSIVAELDSEVIGHVLISKAEVVDNEKHHNVMVLAPVAVKPQFQKQGVGTKLIMECLQRSKDRGVGIVLLIGHPSYYPRLGFKPAKAYGLELKQFHVPDEVFMVCELIEGTLKPKFGDINFQVLIYQGFPVQALKL